MVPIYNSGISLRKCIESILHQTMSSIKIILVDDGSTDKTTVEICEEYHANYSNIVLIHKNNTGVSSARNTGIKAAVSSYIMFVDSDDWIEPRTCEKLYASLNGSQYDIAICGFIREFYAMETIKKRDIILPDCKNIDDNGAFDLSFGLLYEKTLLVAPWAKLYKLSTIKNYSIEFNDKIYFGEDMLFNQDYLRKRRKLVIVNEGLYHYICKNNVSLTKKIDYNKYKINQILFSKSKQFLDDLNIYENNIQYVSKLYLRSCFINIESIYSDENELSREEIREYINRIITAKETQLALKISKSNDIEYILYRKILSTANIPVIKCFAYIRLKFKTILRS